MTRQFVTLGLILLLLCSAAWGASTAHCPHCQAAQPQQATAEGNQRGFSVPLQVIAEEILKALGSNSPLTALLPTISAERIGSISGTVVVGRCENCCEEPSPRLAVLAVIESKGVAESLLPSIYVHPSPRNVNIQAVGPTILDARTDEMHEDEDSTAPGMDSNPDSWFINSNIVIRGQSTKIRFDFWGLFTAVLQTARESNQVETEQDIVELLGDGEQMRIDETWLGDVYPYCTCVGNTATEVPGNGEQALLGSVNQPPLYGFQDAIMIAIPGTTIIPNAFVGTDPDGDRLHFVLSGLGIPVEDVDYSIDSEAGTLRVTVNELPEDEILELLYRHRNFQIYVFDLKPNESVRDGEWPESEQYYHQTYEDVSVTYTKSQPPRALDITETKSIQELRDNRGGYLVRAVFAAADTNPEEEVDGLRLGFRVRKGQALSDWIQRTPELYPRAGSGLMFSCIEESGSDTICRAEVLFEYQSEHGAPPPPGEYQIGFEVYKMDTSTGEIWASNFGTYTLTLTNDAPVAVEDRYENVRLYHSCGYSDTITGSVLINDYDVNGDRMEVHDEGAPSDVPAFGVANVVIPLSEPIHGALLLEKDGSFVYTIDPEHPNGNWFTYRVIDECGALSQPAIVELFVNPLSANHPPSLTVTAPSIHVGIHGERMVLFAALIGDADLDCDNSAEILRVAIETDLEELEVFKDRAWQRLNDAAPLTISRLATPVSGTLDGGIELPIRGVIPAGRKTGWLEVRVTDLAGEAAGERVVFDSGNWYPETLINGNWVRHGNASFDGSVASIGPSMFTMDPAWFEAGCLQFRDLDGDALTFRMIQFPRWGTANLMTSGSGGNYFVTVMYEIDREAMLSCHRDRRDLVDQLTVQATDPHGGASEATMTIRFDVVNSPPVCENDSAVTPSGVPVTIDVLANDSDPDEDALMVAEVATPAGGGASIVGDDVVYTPNPGVCGTETFFYVADDGYEGQTTGWVSVEVLDTIAPVIACQPTTLYLDSNGQATLDPASLDGGSTDNCGIARFEASKTAFGCADVGANTATLTVYDYADNSDACDTTVTVIDSIDPVARGHDLTIQLDEFGSAAIKASDVDGGSSDNCSVTLSLDKSSFDCSDVGANTVTLTATDPSLNADSVSVVVTVEDPIAPVARCHDITASLNSSGTLTLADHAVDNGSTDNCGIASFALSPKSFDCGDVGNHTVTMIVTDASGNSDSCTATVTVVDTTAPTMVCPADVNASADPGQCHATNVNLGSPTATDACGVDWGTLSHNAPSQFPLGDTTVTWTVDDVHGNTASCTQRVTVTETTPPTVPCPGDIAESTHDVTGVIVSFSSSANDNCDPNPSVSSSPVSGSRFPIGTTTVTCTATDWSGNQDTCTFDVIVTFVNQVPVADEIKIVVENFNNPIPITLHGSDADSDPLQYFIVDGPTDGYLTGTPPNVTYNRSGGGLDYDYFSYRVYDGYAYSNTAYVVVDP